MKNSLLLTMLVGLFAGVLSLKASVNVIQHHNNPSRDGLYVVPAFTQSAAANLTRDLGFNGTIVGNVYAQPLYVEGGPNGPMVIAVTESNNVYALNATTGNIIWQRNVGTPISSGLPCGNINPVGITGTPIVDLASRSLFLNAETTPSSGVFKHMIYSLNVDTGVINPGWPVDVGAAVSGFISSIQGERAALGILGNILYVPYGGPFGDCAEYHGWLVGVQLNNPASVMAWHTAAIGGGVWGVGGVASDGMNPFVATGNTFNTGGNWGGGEAVIRLQPGPIFTGQPSDYWAPTNWLSLDNTDSDLGGSGPMLVDVPGATPSALVVQLGKDGKAYLLNRANLGGITAPVASSQVSGAPIIQAAASYRTNQGTYVVFRSSGNTLGTFRITATNPPTITPRWNVGPGNVGWGSPFVTSTGGTNNVIVWLVNALTGDGLRLHGYDGDTGAVVYAGGGADELIVGTHSYNTTGIAARGRIYIGADNKVYAFTVPVAPATDLNRDGKPDYVLYNSTTRRTAIWYLDNNGYVSSGFGPTIPAGWTLIDVGDFNGDGRPDYVLFRASTRRTAIWYLNNNTFVSGVYGPTLPSGWELTAVGDFNRDGRPDYVLYNSTTRRTAIWYLNNNVYVSGLFGPTVAAGYSLTGTADFNRDRKPDYALFNVTTHRTAIWYLNNNVYVSSAYGPTLPTGWSLVRP